MKQYLVCIILLILFFFCSCEFPIGLWSDNIHLSTKSASFKANGDSITIKTGGSFWWLSDVSINNEYVQDTLKENRFNDSFKLDLDSFRIERKDKNTLFVKAAKNKYKTQRQLLITLEAGDYFGHISINQKGQ
jgi:hypothetical protein